jgi:hypothetical protein
MKRIRQSALVRVEAGKASKYILAFAIKQGDLVVLACRISEREQRRKKTIDGQLAWLRYVVESRGGIVVDVVKHVGSGTDASWLEEAARLARLHGAIILAESTDRLRRSRFYHSRLDQDAQATDGELRDLAYWTRRAQVMTFLHPDAAPGEVRDHQQWRGKWWSGNYGGRGNRKPAQRKTYGTRFKDLDDQTRARLEKLVRRGLSVRAIAKRLCRSPSTVAGWLRELRDSANFVHPAKAGLSATGHAK